MTPSGPSAVPGGGVAQPAASSAAAIVAIVRYFKRDARMARKITLPENG